MENNSVFENFEIQLPTEARDFLRSAASWALFLSIMGFIILAFSLIGAFGMMIGASAVNENPMVTKEMSSVMLGGGLVGVVLTVLFFVPIFNLYKFSSNTKQALDINDTLAISESFRSLKRHFMWTSLLTLFSIIVYIIWVIYMAVVVGSAGLSH